MEKQMSIVMTIANSQVTPKSLLKASRAQTTSGGVPSPGCFPSGVSHLIAELFSLILFRESRKCTRQIILTSPKIIQSY